MEKGDNVRRGSNVSAGAAVREDEEEEEEDPLDPRIQVELEKLNSLTDVINKLELDLEEARSQFRILLSDQSRKLDGLSRDLGPTAVDKSRGYYEARMTARTALIEAQHAAARFEKASSAHEAAKEMVTLAEEGFVEKGMHFDAAWQEMLNHATNRVNDAEKDKIDSAKEHKVKSEAYRISEVRVQKLLKTLKRSIAKSRPYFDLKAKLNQNLDDQKRQVEVIEETIAMTKRGYRDSLKELEKISEEIRERRERRKSAANKPRSAAESKMETALSLDVATLGDRGEGVGAEYPDDPEHAGNRRRDNTPKPSDAAIAASSFESCTQPSGVAADPAIRRMLSLDLKQQGDGPPDCGQSTPASSSTSSCSHLQSPSYVRLDEAAAVEASEAAAAVEASEAAAAATTPCNDWQPIQLSPSSASAASPAATAVAEKGMSYLTVAEAVVDDSSDTESLGSMDIIDDDMIAQLMKSPVEEEMDSGRLAFKVAVGGTGGTPIPP